MPLYRARFMTALLLAFCLLALPVACSRSDDDEEDGGGKAAEAKLAPYTPPAPDKLGSIKGVVSFAGSPPEVGTIPMDADANCARANPEAKAEDVIVNGDKVQYAFVYVKDGTFSDGNKKINSFSFESPSEPLLLDQAGCMYKPRVIGIQTRQRLLIANSDQTTHNVNVQAAKNEKINPSQPPGQPPIEHSFSQPETLVPVKCNQHPWMKAYIGVLRHPFFAVTQPDGSFEIKNLPPGEYTIEVWHERLKTQTQKITVASGEQKTGVTFTYNAATASNELDGGSLTVMPALEVPLLGRRKHH